MKKVLLKFIFGLGCCLLTVGSIHCQEQILAFPGAEGFGKYAVGGRYGSVYKVTNLNDSGTGSLRDALSSGNRIIIFEVGGVIKINSPLVVKANTYIAGQTAPGEGITIYGDGISLSGADNSICRYIRVRAGKESTREDALGLANGQNIIFDHVSVSWGNDEVFSVTSDKTAKDSRNITIQNCIVSQGLLGHSAGGLCEPDGEITVYRTLFINNTTRNFKMKGTTQYVNNIVYNWKGDGGHIMGGGSTSPHYGNAVGNYFITGPGGGTQAFSRGNSLYQIYVEDNMVDKNANGILDGEPVPIEDFTDKYGTPTFMTKPFDYPELPTLPASELFEDLLKDVGANLPYRDDLDWFLLDEIRSLGTKGSIISRESDLSIGIPTAWNLWEGNSRVDTDGDGIPDEWELIIGSDPNVDDAMVIREDKGGYANIELYINAITTEHSQYFLKTPINLVAGSVTENEILLEWLDVTDHEEGYIIEEKIDDAFVEIVRVGKDVTSYHVEELEPQSYHTYRVRAFANENVTNPSNELTVRTKPIPVSVVDPNTFEPDMTWTGETSGHWNHTAENWDHETKMFRSGVSILFDESGLNKEIEVTEDVEQSTMFVKGDHDYSFTGEGAIGGDGSVNKTGEGKLILGTNNTYTGATVLHGGTMEISQLANGNEPSSIGASEPYDFNWVWNGGTIRYTGGSVSTDRDAALEDATVFEVADPSATVTFNGIIGGEGDFVKTGPGTVYSSFGQHEYTGNTIVKEGTYQLNGRYQSVGIHGSLILDGGRFKTSGGADGEDGIYDFPVIVNSDSYFEPTRVSKINSDFSGMGNLTLELCWAREHFQGNWDEFYGDLTLAKTSAGPSPGTWFLINNETNGSGVPNARVIAQKGIQIVGGKTDATYVFGALSGESGSYLQGVYVKNNNGRVTWKVGSLNTDEDFHGQITNEAASATYKGGTTNIIKEGDGYWRLTANNIYSGTTAINGGTLIVNGTNSGTGAITVNAGGVLSGTGSVAGAVTVKNEGEIDPGDHGIGTLTIRNSTKFESGSTLNIDIDMNGKKADKLTVNGEITLGGTLNINLMDGEFTLGDEVVIMSATSYSGEFEKIEPEYPADGLYWGTSLLGKTGVLYITNDPTNIATHRDGPEIIRSSKGVILVEGLEKTENITVFNLSGIAVYSRQVNAGSCEISVESGIYFVKVGERTVKILVK